MRSNSVARVSGASTSNMGGLNPGCSCRFSPAHIADLWQICAFPGAAARRKRPRSVALIQSHRMNASNSSLRQVVLASGNPGKLREFSALFAPLGIELIPQSRFGVSEAEEPYCTFVE